MSGAAGAVPGGALPQAAMVAMSRCVSGRWIAVKRLPRGGAVMGA